MRKLVIITFASMITLSGCGSESNELIDAINNSYNMDSGSIISNFQYTTEYGNIDIEGTVSGTIIADFSSDLDKVTASVNFKGSEESFEYYIDDKGNVIVSDSNADVLYSPLYDEAPDLEQYIGSIPVPESKTIKVDGEDVLVNEYNFKLDNLNNEVVKSLFDTVVKLGFVSSDILKEENIEGTYNLSFDVEAETGQLVEERLEYMSQGESSLSTSTSISVSNTYSYDNVDVDLPSEAISEAEE